jgi:hypothetical protein
MNPAEVRSMTTLISLAPYALLTLALIGLLAVYFTLKREIGAQARRNRRIEAMLVRLKEATAPLEDGHASGRVLDPWRIDSKGDAPPLAWIAAPRSGMNLSRRVQALRLLRRGEDLGFIASALGVPRCEVELLVRVHRLSLGLSPPAASKRQAEIQFQPPVRGGPVSALEV